MRASLTISLSLFILLGSLPAVAEFEFKPGVEAAHPVLGTAFGPDEAWYHGGPVLSLTLPTSKGTPTGDLVWGISYEMARPRWLVYSAGVETDFDRTAVNLGALAASPMFPAGAGGPPMLGLALGLSGQLEFGAGTHAGLRIQILMLLGGVFAFGNNLEWFPGTSEPFRHALVVRLSL
jgi:hypothetical protein